MGILAQNRLNLLDLLEKKKFHRNGDIVGIMKIWHFSLKVGKKGEISKKWGSHLIFLNVSSAKLMYSGQGGFTPPYFI